MGTDDVSLSGLVRAYAVFPRAGAATPPVYFIDRIVDSSGDIRYRADTGGSGSGQVVSQSTAFLMHTMLQSALEKGAGGTVELPADPSLAGKTGTTYDFADNWFAGYNSRVTCALWMGYLDGSRKPIYPGAFSHETVFPAWAKTMEAAAKDFPGSGIDAPEDVVRLDVCKSSGLRKTRYCHEYKRNPLSGAETYVSTTAREYFLKGSEPPGYCDVHGAADPGVIDVRPLGPHGTDVYAIPIQPKRPLLLGQDPYGCTQPDFAPRDTGPGRGEAGVMSFDRLDRADKDADITLPRPRRIEIREQL